MKRQHEAMTDLEHEYLNAPVKKLNEAQRRDAMLVWDKRNALAFAANDEYRREQKLKNLADENGEAEMDEEAFSADNVEDIRNRAKA